MYNCEIDVAQYEHAGTNFEQFGPFSTAGLSEKTTIAPQRLTARQSALADACRGCKRQIIALLDQVFPAYNSPVSDPGCTSYQALPFKLNRRTSANSTM